MKPVSITLFNYQILFMKVFPTMFFFPCRIRFIHFIFKWLKSLNMFFQIFHYYTTQFLDFKKSNLVKWIVSCPLYSLLNVAFIAVFRKYLENAVKYGLQLELSMIYSFMCEIFFSFDTFSGGGRVWTVY